MRMICAICGFAKADIYFLPLVCVSGQQHIGVCTLFCLPCSHVPEQRITHGGAAKHISGSCVFGSSFYADQSCLMPAESMGMGRNVAVVPGNHIAAHPHCILLPGAWDFTGNLRQLTCLSALHLYIDPKRGVRNLGNEWRENETAQRVCCGAGRRWYFAIYLALLPSTPSQSCSKSGFAPWDPESINQNWSQWSVALSRNDQHTTSFCCTGH